MTVLRMLLPGPAEVGDLGRAREAALQAVADLYAYPEPLPRAGWVRANMVSSLDGAASGPDGRSGTISSPVDKAVFGTLRALADVVLVGAGTARAEGYRAPTPHPLFGERRGAAGQPPAAVLAVVTRRGDLPDELLDDGTTLVVTTAGADGRHRLGGRVGADRLLVAGDGELDLPAAVASLAARGLGKVLLEGGPGLLGTALDAGRVDELCLTWSPLLAGGDAPRIVTGAAAVAAARPAHLLEGDGVLLGRWLLRPGDR